MENKQKTSVSGPAPAEERQQQARDIMQQLITEGLFAPGEAAEITFSDSKIIAIPEDDSTNNKPSENK